MLRLIKKLLLYGLLILITLELLVRVFHLYNDRPTRYINEKGIQAWIPGQEGYSVYGNRRQTFAEYRINASGYNSYREFKPTKLGYEVALVGDSFIEGFHQDYDNSIGKKIERRLDNAVEVYEYGHSSNDFADQLQLVKSYSDKFELIDHIFLGLKFENDLTRPKYALIKRQPVFPILRHSKLYLYLQTIGFLDPVKNVIPRVKKLIKKRALQGKQRAAEETDRFNEYLENFKTLTEYYSYDKSKMTLLLDSRITDSRFLDYLNKEGFPYIDFSSEFEKTDKNTTLIYDRHWNNHGRNIIAKLLIEDIKKNVSEKN